MASPYRWGDVTPPRALELKRRREYRGSEFFARVKARRGEEFDQERAATSSAPRPSLSVVAPIAPLVESQEVELRGPEQRPMQ
jgi:hypothetical protein